MSVVLILALLGWPASAGAQSGVSDPDVLKGIRLVDEGDYDGAIVTLDGAVRRFSGDPAHAADLPQAYLYLGIAFVGKGHEAAAKAKFREALRQAKNLNLSSDKFPPKIIDLFEAAREEMGREGPAAAPSTAPSPAPVAKKGGGGKTLLILGGVALAGGGIALAAGGSKGSPSASPNSTLVTTTFANQVVAFGGGRDFMVDVSGSGQLTARCDWQNDGVLLAMYIVNLASPSVVLADGGQTAAKEVTLSIPVTQGSYRVSVTNSTGTGPNVDTTFTLTVVHP